MEAFDAKNVCPVTVTLRDLLNPIFFFLKNIFSVKFALLLHIRLPRQYYIRAGFGPAHWPKHKLKPLLLSEMYPFEPK